MKRRLQCSITESKYLISLLICVSIVAFCKDSQAQTFFGGFAPSRVVQLRWISSASSNYTGTYITPGADGWTGISSQVSLSKVISGSYDVRVGTSTTAQTGLYGLTTPYCSSGGANYQGEACVTVPNWGSAQITGYTNQMANDNLNTTQIISSVYCHEFGHALSLAHTDPNVIAVMRSGIISSYLPQALDKSNLKAKWGN